MFDFRHIKSNASLGAGGPLPESALAFLQNEGENFVKALSHPKLLMKNAPSVIKTIVDAYMRFVFNVLMFECLFDCFFFSAMKVLDKRNADMQQLLTELTQEHHNLEVAMHQAEVQRREESVVPNRREEDLIGGPRAGSSRANQDDRHRQVGTSHGHHRDRFHSESQAGSSRSNRQHGAGGSSRAGTSRTGERRPRVLNIPRHVSKILNVCLFVCLNVIKPF